MKIKLSEIKSPEAIRDHGDIKSLKESIQKCGLINPITIDQNYKCLAGRRRYQAVKELGWEEVDVRIVDVDNPLKSLKVTIEENIKRKQLTDLEVAAQIKEYDGLKRRLEGEKGRGRPNNSAQCTELNGWTYQKTASDFGVSEPSVRKAIKIAEAVEEFPELAEKKSGQQILTAYNRKTAKTPPSLPIGKFRVIMADPPWQYDFSLSDSRAIESHYDSLDVDSICDYCDDNGKLVYELFADNAVLFLWATQPKIREALQVMEAWGFEYKTGAIWIKDKIGMGYYWREQHELLLVGTKGNVQPPEPENRSPSIFHAPRTKHSKKPECVYEMIEIMYPLEGDKEQYLELFARTTRPNWVGWGTEYGKV